MGKDLFGGKEPAKERATRIWRNHALSQRFKKMKETGKGEDEFFFRDGKKPIISAQVPKPPREELPKPADVLENPRPKVDKFERKFVKDIREMMEGHKQRNVALYVAAILHEKRRLMIEMIKRLEAQNAAREGAKS
jgi:hypothetical protein